MKKLGFGCMRLPTRHGKENAVDHTRFRAMIDRFMEAGFCYFDTAHVYLGGNSETAIRDDLVARYPRDSFLLANKLSGSCFEKEEDIRPLFEKQLEACGVTYFDYYLMHALTEKTYKKFKDCNAFKVVKELKKEGKIKHFGISFHDKPEVLIRILRWNPDIEVVQIQLNYLDFDDPVIQSARLYEICQDKHKSVIVMEPVRGGVLAKVPDKAKKLFKELGKASPASYAIRYAASFPCVSVVLSGMSTLPQMSDNIACMKDFEPLSYEERKVVYRVRDIFKQESYNMCTGCRYCERGCPKNIPIPDVLACADTKRRFNDWGSDFYYNTAVDGKGRASDCIKCHRCEDICPQLLRVTALVNDAARLFDKPEDKEDAP